MQMSDAPKPVRSMIHWVEPPEVGQPLEELEWTFIDTFDDGSVVIRDVPPTPEEVAGVIEELRPYFSTEPKKPKH